MDKIIGSAGAFIKLSISKEYYEQMIDDEFFYAYIPAVTICKEEHIEYDAEIKIMKSSKNQIILKYPLIVLKSIKMNVKDIITLLEFVFERARQEKGIICIHGAAAIVNDKAVVCWGPATGMGKTSLALEISKGHNFYSDEKVLIDLNLGCTAGGISRQYLSTNYWKEKFGDKNYLIHPNIISTKTNYPISLFVYGILCDQEKPFYEKWKSSKFFWHLYEESSRKIRGTSRMFFNFSYPIQSLDTHELSTKRLDLIKKFTDKYPTIYYKGDINTISSGIISFMNK